MASTKTLTGDKFDRQLFESVMKRRFFFTEPFEIYHLAPNFKGDNRGLFDYGPPGCALQANIVDAWRKHFVLEENMLELDCTVITPEPVLRTSGHVDKFADWMCKDPIKGECSPRGDYLRADHLVENVLKARLARGTRGLVKDSPKLDQVTVDEYNSILAMITPPIDNYDGDALAELIRQHDIWNPENNNQVLPPVPFNLMFKSTNGSSAAAPVYLRPETAQGQFLDFKKLLDRETQLLGETKPRATTVGQGVESGVIDNETLGYFLARVMLFLVRLGVDSSKVRFRQHLANEMAHYACDCWDPELLTSYGWVECVGCADRSAYDLTVHSKYTGASLTVKEALAEPVVVEEWQATLDKKLVGPRFKKDAKVVQSAVEALDQATLERLAAELGRNGVVAIDTPALSDGTTHVELTKELLSIAKTTRLQNTREYTPNVIEPSFGIGRIVYSVLEHVYWHRLNDAARAVLSLPLAVAPNKVLIVPLSSNPELTPIARKISARLRKMGIANLGTPLGVTVNFDTLKDGSVTLRERDSMVQVRDSEHSIVAAIRGLVEGTKTWDQVMQRMEIFGGQEDDQ
ncbi:glycyl-tRNA synthetase [Parathielavia hyrcaniae]|uniref:Glycyl-tRNA synthetase n=1 Tax=Parathielavia hyrcaniae TaxID=113614 RepID=A0AAN6PRD6_9PEZI|nr:glycyl-tRNA synthetase [Parathielavia hyrcaniae]